MLFSFEKMGFYTDGIIHIGAKQGNIVSVYKTEGVKRILWVEKQVNLYGELYKTTINYPIHQLYYMQELSNITQKNKITFKDLWRRNPGDIDIDSYETLAIFCKNNMKEIMEGFGDFINLFKFVILHDEIIENKAHTYLVKNNYVEFVSSDNFIVYKNNLKA